MRVLIGPRLVFMVSVLAMEAWPVSAQTECLSPSNGPDVIVGDLPGIVKWGSVNDITGYSVGTDSCNIGDENLLWQAQTDQHPVIAQNMYRLKEGRFEQIGMSWLKHGFQALALDLCCECDDPNDGSLLGVGCSDPYSASLNGDQSGFGGGGGLGPRSEVNPSTGVFAFPYMDQGQTGNAIYKRLQVRNEDLDPSLNPGALYFVEGHYVTPDDALATNHHNNASYRRIEVGSFSGGGWNVDVVDVEETQRTEPAIFAWNAADPDAKRSKIKSTNDGIMYLGYKATDLGNGVWHYEYALHNLSSHRAVRLLEVPVLAETTVSNIGFHDIDYYSGEPYDGTDWASSHASGRVTWSTDTFAANENANALRWGTLYNFRFDANAPPRTVTASIGLFRPGSPETISVPTVGPVGPPGAPMTAPHPHDRRKNRYISFDPNKAENDAVDIAFKVTLQAITLGSCDGNGGFCRLDRGDGDCKACSIDGNPCINQPIDCAPMPPQSCDPTEESCVNDAPDVGGTSVGRVWWVGPESPRGNGVHLLVSEPFRKESPNWPNPTHVGDCEVVPEAVYDVQAVNTDTGAESGEVQVETTLFASISSSWWGDCVGPLQKFCGGDFRTTGCGDDGDCPQPDTCDPAWTLPDGAVNVDDISAALALLIQDPKKPLPHTTWVDVHGTVPDVQSSQNFGPPNYVLNHSDILQIIFGFAGRPYTFFDPADCPDEPEWP